MAWITKKRDKRAVGFYDQDKKRRLKVLPKDAKKSDAKVKLREIEELIEKRAFIPKNEVPLFSEVSRDWLNHKRATEIRPTTWETYRGHVRHHFRDLDSLKVNEIDTPMIEKWLDGQTINPGTLKKVVVTLNQIFNYAKRHKLIQVNPLTDAERPTKGSKQKITLLNASQVKELLLKTDHIKHRVPFMLAIFSGARQGELLGLKWTDIDFKACQVHIKRTYTKGRFFDTKNEKERKVDLAPVVMDVLREWQGLCRGGELVFPNNNGNPMNYSNMMNRHFFPALKRAGLPRIRFHSLRHTYASLLIENRESIKYIQTQLGHSSPMVTLNVYSHLFEDKNQDTPLRLQGKIFGNGDQIETKTLFLTK